MTKLTFFALIAVTLISKEILSLKLSSVENCYKKGVSAYSGERWTECIVQLEEALHLYKLYKSIKINCRLQCNYYSSESIVQVEIDNLRMYEKFFNARNCLIKCLRNEFEDMHLSREVQESVLKNIHMRKPYEYLHICYFQMYALPKAASAAYTYLMVNPEDETMKKNLEYYIDQPEVDVNEVIDLESEEYAVLYNMGVKAYNKKNWLETIAYMDELILDYLSWENRCRVECEEQPQQETDSEFMITVSNNIASLLLCQQQCQNAVKQLKYDSGVEFLADILNYLQISYYHVEKYDNAAKTVASYLFLLPNDKDMLTNKDIYSKLVTDDAFEVRSDIVHYYKRDIYEKQLLELYDQGYDAMMANSI